MGLLRPGDPDLPSISISVLSDAGAASDLPNGGHDFQQYVRQRCDPTAAIGHAGRRLRPLLGLYLQTFVVQVTMLACGSSYHLCYRVVNGEIYLMVSLAADSVRNLLETMSRAIPVKTTCILFAPGFPCFLITVWQRHLCKSDSEPVLFR